MYYKHAQLEAPNQTRSTWLKPLYHCGASPLFPILLILPVPSITDAIKVQIKIGKKNVKMWIIFKGV